MSRVALAFRCFFRLLFRGSLPPRAVEYLPEEALPALPAGVEEAGEAEEVPPEAKPAPQAEARETRPRPERRTADAAAHHRDGALALLALLQREGRFVDFLCEDLDDYEDADIGASVRDIHRGCKKVIEEHLDLEAVMPGAEDEAVTVPRGFDPGEVRLVGDVKGDPPFEGVLRHHGWRVTETKLPTLSDGVDRHVLAPAEVEIS